MTMPNFIIVGAVKSGTSSTFKYMRQHPEIFTSRPKEPSFFLFDGRLPDFHGPGDQQFYRNKTATLEEYAALFADAGDKKAIGEASASYLHDERAAERIFNAVPEAKIIVVLRNPIERAYSHYWMYRAAGRETEPFARALNLESKRKQMNWSPGWQYSRIGFYSEHVSRYLSFFPREQCLFTLYDDLNNDAVSFMKRIFDFLEVDNNFAPDVNVKYNVTGDSDSRLANFLLKSRHPIRGIVRNVVPRELRNHLITRLRQRYLRKPDMPKDCRERLRSMYCDDISKLENILGRPLAHWLE